jgi:rhamnosyl/mannosyltransferase
MIATEKPPVRGGVARTIDYLCDGLARHGHEVDVWAFPEIARLQMGQVRLSAMPFRIVGLHRNLTSYDVLHIHGVAPTISDFALAAARLQRKRPVVVYTHHAELDFGPQLLKRAYNRAHGWLSFTADETVCTAFGPVSTFSDPRSASVIPLGVDAGRFASKFRKSEPFNVLYVGQFRAYKAVPVLMRAMARVHGVKLLIAGSGEAEKSYRTLAKALGLDVEFHVGVDDDALSVLYQRAHAVVLPSTSRQEAFGLVLLEGMAAGCVPIASHLPGVREVVGRTGFTFQPGSVDELTHLLRQLRDQPVLVEEIGLRARLRAATFGRERMVNEYERLFLDLMAARQLRMDVGSGADLSSAVETFLSDVGSGMQAETVEVMFSNGHGPVHIASGRHSSEEQISGAESIRSYASSTGESLRLDPNNIPPVLIDCLRNWRGAAVAAPLYARQIRVGALTATRAAAFDDSDVIAWARVARHLAMILQTSGRSNEFGARPLSSALVPGEV